MPYLPKNLVDKMLQAPEIKGGRPIQGISHEQNNYMSALFLKTNNSAEKKKKRVNY